MKQSLRTKLNTYIKIYKEVSYDEIERLPRKFICPQCQKEFPNRYGKISKFCSRQCRYNSQKGKVPWNKGLTGIYSEETRKKMGIDKIGKCLLLETKEKIRIKLKGKKRPPFSSEWKEKIRQDTLKSPRKYWLGKKREDFSEKFKGENHWNWKGGISFQPYPIFWTKQLRLKIRKKYNFTCQLCFEKGKDVHHINYDKNNCNENNLIILCHKCHSKTNIKNRDYWKSYFYEKIS